MYTMKLAFELPAIDSASEVAACPRAIAPLAPPQYYPLSICSLYALQHREAVAAYELASSSQNAGNVGASGSSESNELDEEVEAYLTTLKPRDWKSQDHYLVLGLHHLRYRATPQDVEAKFRRQVLRHHPDKIAARSSATNSDSIFKCIQKAYETLIDPVKRLQFDSVDPAVKDITCSAAQMKTMVENGTFYEEMQRIFDLEERFSSRLHRNNGSRMPRFGDAESPRNAVEGFYKAWFAMESLRSYEYEDKEDTECMDNRDNKRYVERKNKAERARKKQEDQTRLVQLFDTVYKVDPRNKIFREQDKAQKELARKLKSAPASSSNSARGAVADTVSSSAPVAETTPEAVVAEKSPAELQKAAKEAQRNLAKKTRKSVRQAAFGGCDEASVDKSIVDLVEALFAACKEPESLKQVADQIQAAGASQEATLDIIRERLGLGVGLEPEKTAKQLEKVEETTEKQQQQEQEQQHVPVEKTKTAQVSPKGLVSQRVAQLNAASVVPEWTPADMEALIAAANKTPAGVHGRWDVIAEEVKKHGSGFAWSSSQCAEKSNQILRMQCRPTPRGAQAQSKSTEAAATGTAGSETSWTAEEQKQLQDAMRKYPSTMSGATDRWELIAAEVTGKSRAECMMRAKYLIDQLKARNDTKAS